MKVTETVQSIWQRLMAALRRAFHSFEHERTDHSSTWEFHLHAECDDIDGGFVAWVDELPGCVSHGNTEDEALANLNEAILLVVEVKLEEALAADGHTTADTSTSLNVRIA